jgi:nitroreductase
MKDIFSVINNRRTCKRFSDKRITRDDLMLLIEYGTKAPSAANLQDYRFIVTMEREKMLALPDACMEQDFVSQAGGVIVVCSQPDLVKEFFPEVGEKMASQGASAAIQNILLAAQGLGLGACWVGGFIPSAVKEIFEIPDNVNVEGIIAIGHPYSKPDEKTEKPYEQLVYLNTFGNDKKDIDALNKDYSVKIQKHITAAKRDVKSYEERMQRVSQKLKDFFIKDTSDNKDK